MPDVFVGLGSNVGAPEDNLRRAVRALGGLMRVRTISSLYRTAPVGPVDQPFFLNAVLEGPTERTPRELVSAFRVIEDAMGRSRDVPMGPRTLDLDLLLYGSVVLDEPGLQVPHPRMTGRRFVLAPLAEIAPDVPHPVMGRSAAELLAGLDDGGSAERLVVEGWPPAPGS